MVMSFSPAAKQHVLIPPFQVFLFPKKKWEIGIFLSDLDEVEEEVEFMNFSPVGSLIALHSRDDFFFKGKGE